MHPRITPLRNRRESGMALFIVLVIVVVLTIVIFQLAFTTKIEERIARNRQETFGLGVSLLASCKDAIQALETDLMEDLGMVAEEDPGGAGGDKPPDDGPPDLGGAGGGSNGDADGEKERFDTRHEEWAGLQNDTINEVEIERWVESNDGKIDLNHLFSYAQRPEEEEDDGAADGPPDDPPDDPPADPQDPDADPTEEEEYVPPTTEEVEDAERIVSRLIQALISSNQEADFEYVDLPDPDQVAREIVQWVLELQAQEETRLLHSVDGLRRLDGVTWELFSGPSPPEEDEESGFDEEPLDPEDAIEDLAMDLGELPGYEQLDKGVQEIARPRGLRDLLTAHSTGKVNLNTARPEVIAALLLGIEDIDEALEIAHSIYEFLDSYEVPEDGPEQAGTDDTEETDEETQDFNVLRRFDDLGKVDETWTETTGVDDPSILELLRADLEKVSTFHSSFFVVRVHGERDGRTLAGTMQIARVEEDIIVISWEESDR